MVITSYQLRKMDIFYTFGTSCSIFSAVSWQHEAFYRTMGDKERTYYAPTTDCALTATVLIVSAKNIASNVYIQ